MPGALILFCLYYDCCSGKETNYIIRMFGETACFLRIPRYLVFCLVLLKRHCQLRPAAHRRQHVPPPLEKI